MAAEVGDTFVSWDTSGSGVFGADTTSVYGHNASKSTVSKPTVLNTEEEVLRLRVKGLRLGREKLDWWQDVVISRARHRKVAIHLLSKQQASLGRDKEHSYVVRSASHDISTDHIGSKLTLTT